MICRLVTYEGPTETWEKDPRDLWKVGTSWISRKEGNLRRGGGWSRKGGYDPLTNYDKINSISVKSQHDRIEYWDPGEINEPENSNDSLHFLHLNISSLPYYFSELQTLLSSTKVNFDIIGISESRIKQNKNPTYNINLQNYNTEHCTTETANGGILLYIKDNIIHKLRKDLKI